MCQINWEALTAIGTLAVAVVAVWPIFEAHWRRRKAARSLRRRLLPQLRFIGQTIIAPRANPGSSLLMTPLASEEAKEIVPLEQALAQAELLSPEEQDALAAAVTWLKIAAYRPPPAPPVGQWLDIVAVLKVLHNALHAKVKDSKFAAWQ